MSGEPQEPTPGAGLRHAVALAVAALLPVTYAMSVAAGDAIDGFRPWAMIAVTLILAVAAAFVSVGFPLPSIPQVIGRVVLVALLALGMRFTVPSPSLALEQVRAGEASLLSGTFLLALPLLGIAFTVGHALARSVAHLATPARTVDIARDRDRRALVVWWWGLLVQVFVVGVTRSSGGATASGLLVVGAVASLLLLADLRLRTAPPAATRPPIVAAPRPIRRAGALFGLLVIIGLAAAVTPLVPVESLRSPPSVPGWLQGFEFGEPQARELVENVTGGDPSEPLPEEEPPDEGTERDWSIPTPPWQLVAAVAAIGLVALLRPHRWRRGLWRLLAILRGSRWVDGDDAGAGELTHLEELEDEAGDDGEHGRLRRAFERLRPRPRDARSAVLHDYFHVERILAKHEQGRQGYETPHEHAVRVHVSDTHEELADLAADARFARTPPPPDAVARARELRHEIEQALRAARRP